LVLAENLLNFVIDWGEGSLENNLQQWINKNKTLKALPGFTCWGIWTYRNNILFNNKALSLDLCVIKIIISFKEYQKQPREKIVRTIYDLPSSEILVKGFFDGATQGGVCGVGFVLQENHSRFFRGWMGGGINANTKAEMLGLWALLTMDLKLDLECLQVFGDSQVIINWAMGKGKLRNIVHQHWGKIIRECVASFDSIEFMHIFRELNVEVDLMSKKALIGDTGTCFYEEIRVGEVVSRGHFKLF
jgi:ribonuclease HI